MEVYRNCPYLLENRKSILAVRLALQQKLGSGTMEPRVYDLNTFVLLFSYSSFLLAKLGSCFHESFQRLPLLNDNPQLFI